MTNRYFCTVFVTLLACGTTDKAGFDREVFATAEGEARVCAPGPTVAGIDVSEFQGTVNWDAVRNSGRVFGIARVSDSLVAIDPTFSRNWSEMKRLGMVRGAYQLFRASQSAREQARVMINAVGRLGPNDLPAVLDIEVRSDRTDSEIIAAMRTWLDLVEQGTGKRPIIYTADFFWSTLSGASEFSRYPLWVANFGVSCPFVPGSWTNWRIWQTSETGRVSGISGNVDLDVFNGTEAQLRAFAAGGTVSEPGGAGGNGGGAPPVNNIPLESLNVTVFRDLFGIEGPNRDQFRVRGSDRVVSMQFSVDGFVLSNPTLDANGEFVLRTSLSLTAEQRRFVAVGFDSQGRAIARGLALFDATDTSGVQIRQVGGANFEISVERVTSEVRAIEVRVDGTLLTDALTGMTRSSRLAVQASLLLAEERTFKISTFDANGNLRGTITRVSTLVF